MCILEPGQFGRSIQHLPVPGLWEGIAGEDSLLFLPLGCNTGLQALQSGDHGVLPGFLPSGMA